MKNKKSELDKMFYKEHPELENLAKDAAYPFFTMAIAMSIFAIGIFLLPYILPYP